MSLLELCAIFFLAFLGAAAFGLWKGKDKPNSGCACSGLAGLTALLSGFALMQYEALQGRGPGEVAVAIAIASMILSVVAAFAGSLVRGQRFGLAWAILIGFGLQYIFLFGVVYRD